jgi:hypothetical protein
VTEQQDAWDYTRNEGLRLAALFIFGLAFVAGAVWAVVQTVKGFVEGVLEARDRHLERKAESAAGETPFPDRPRPAARPRPPVPPAQARSAHPQNYTVEMDGDNEVTINGLPIGHVDASPWQFCSYDAAYGNGPVRESKARAFDDACDYAESVVRSA